MKSILRKTIFRRRGHLVASVRGSHILRKGVVPGTEDGPLGKPIQRKSNRLSLRRKKGPNGRPCAQRKKKEDTRGIATGRRLSIRGSPIDQEREGHTSTPF